MYNALNDTDYKNVEELEINTLDDVIYMGMKNDVSCILDSSMSLYEHQSTYNPNMPLRGFIYFGKLYSNYVSLKALNMYSYKQQKIPTPQYYVFYNGVKDYPDRVELKLSDAFIKQDESHNFEWTAIMLNINKGHNEKLLAACKVLEDYAILIDTIRKYQENETEMEVAIIKAIDQCIKNNILVDFLKEHKSEVIDMCLEEYDEEKTLKMLADEAREEGEIVGIEEGKKLGRAESERQAIERMLTKLSPEEVIELGYEKDQVMEIYNQK